MPDGLEKKFVVTAASSWAQANAVLITREDGSHGPGCRHGECEYLVIDLHHDLYASAAVRAYATACARTHPKLSADLMKLALMSMGHAMKEATKK